MGIGRLSELACAMSTCRDAPLVPAEVRLLNRCVDRLADGRRGLGDVSVLFVRLLTHDDIAFVLQEHARLQLAPTNAGRHATKLVPARATIQD